MVFERRNVVFNILIDEKTQKNILIMDLMGKRQAPTDGKYDCHSYELDSKGQVLILADNKTKGRGL